MKKTLENTTKEINRALKKLSPEQGRVARNNARRSMMKALKDARRALDKEFPVIRAKPKPRRIGRAKPPKNWIRVDFERFTGGSEKSKFIADCAAAGIKLRYYKSGGYHPKKYLYAPMWALAAYGQGSNLATVAKSRTKQQALVSAWRIANVAG